MPVEEIRSALAREINTIFDCNISDNNVFTDVTVPVLTHVAGFKGLKRDNPIVIANEKGVGAIIIPVVDFNFMLAGEIFADEYVEDANWHFYSSIEQVTNPSANEEQHKGFDPIENYQDPEEPSIFQKLAYYIKHIFTT